MFRAAEVTDLLRHLEALELLGACESGTVDLLLLRVQNKGVAIAVGAVNGRLVTTSAPGVQQRAALVLAVATSLLNPREDTHV